MFPSFARSRGLIWAFALRDFHTRYRASLLGWAWSLLQPLAQLTVYAIVFTQVFRVATPELGRGHGASFVLYLFTGMVAFNFFQGVLNISMNSLKASGDLLRKVSFPAYAPVLGSTLVQLVQAGMELCVLLIGFLVVGNVGLPWLAAPVLLFGLALMTQGIGLVLASANARYGDVALIVGVGLSALYFLTPVLYPLEALPDQTPLLRLFVTYQPLSWFVQGLHDCLYELRWPSAGLLVGSLAFGALVFAGGLALFERTTQDIGELL